MANLIIACPGCHKLNRVPEEKLHSNGNCGSCKTPLFQKAPLDLSQASFSNHIVKSDLPTLVDFWAPWCGPCKMMAPVLAQAASTFEPRLRIAKINTEEEQLLGGQFNIRSIPTLVLFSKGKEIDRISGAMNLPQLSQWLNQALSKI